LRAGLSGGTLYLTPAWPEFKRMRLIVNVVRLQIYTKKAGPSLVFVNFLALASAPFYLTKTSFRWLIL
jgi:hypothetical protein